MKFLFSLLLIWYFSATLAQGFEWPALTYKPKEFCGRNDTYDITMLDCLKCKHDLAHPTFYGKTVYSTVTSCHTNINNNF